MRRNVFTSYIISNSLNLETFFEPIIDFIEIGNQGNSPPLRTVYENFISYSSNRNTQILVETDICTKKKLRTSMTQKSSMKMTIENEKRKIRKLFVVVILPKYQVGSFISWCWSLQAYWILYLPIFIFLNLVVIFICM